MTQTQTGCERERFAVLFEELSPRVFAYARRHCDAATAQDVVSDTFLVAWRRRAELPEAPLPWLIVVARNTLHNRRRHLLRQRHLVGEIARLDEVARPADGPDRSVVERAAFLAALGLLTELEREALLLVAWDGLTGPEAARVAGCSLRAFEVRLSRARARLSRAMEESPPGRASAPPGPKTSSGPTISPDPATMRRARS